jgi:adenylate kinase
MPPTPLASPFMRLLLVAPPGAGKGTQAAKLSAHYHIAHLSSGELLRRDAAAGTDVGRLAADYLLRGDLVPDEVVIELLTVPVLEAVRNGGYVLDGFPRTLRQAEEAYQVARQIEGVELQAVIHLEVGREEIRRRLVARGLRDGRSDDTEVAIAHRLDVFAAETEPMLGFYAERGLVLDINGEQQVDRVFVDIVTAVDLATADRR